MKTTPYFTKENRHITGSVNYQLYFRTGDGADLIFTYHQEHLAAAAEKIANDAYNRGRLVELRSRKHQLNVDTQKLWEILDSLT